MVIYMIAHTIAHLSHLSTDPFYVLAAVLVASAVVCFGIGGGTLLVRAFQGK